LIESEKCLGPDLVLLISAIQDLDDIPVCRSGTSFQFFPGGGNILTEFLGGGQNMKNTKFCRQKHKKVTIFQNQGRQMASPPPNDVPAADPERDFVRE